MPLHVRKPICSAPRACRGIRDAIAFGDGPNTFACNVPTTVTSGSEIVIDTDVILDGEGNLLVNGNDTHRVFSVAFGVTVELRRLTVTRGNAEDGAGVLSNGTLTITDSVISNNSASREGGGVLASGP